MTYRSDIDGLRAIAILSIVLFHAGIPGFSGGFVGVDVFFVISGFLITSILWNDWERDNFSLKRFYQNRVLRILPLLAVVLSVVALAGFLMLPGDQFRFLGRSILSGAIFAKNIANYRMAFNYFAPQSSEDPLLHLWSLSIEEQFYLFYPAFFVLVMTFFRKHVWKAMLTATALFFLAAELRLKGVGQGAFYLAQYRAGELLMGAFVALLPHRPSREWLAEFVSLTGLFCILFAIVEFDHETKFPGFSALIPCGGTAMILWAGASTKKVGALIGNRLFIFVGLISYSLYLWHWPVFVFTDLSYWKPLTLPLRFGLLAVTFLLSFTTWKYVEEPLRRLKGIKRNWGTGLVLASLALLCGLGNSFRHTDGVFTEMQTALAGNLAVETPKYKLCEGLVCPFNGPAEKAEIALWGDSHAQALADAVGEAAEESHTPWVMMAKGGCPPMLGIGVSAGGIHRGCREEAAAALEVIRTTPTIREVILSGRWALYANGTRLGKDHLPNISLCEEDRCPEGTFHNFTYFERGLERTINALTAMGKKVTIVGPIPEMGANIVNVLRTTRVSGQKPPTLVTRRQFEARQKYVLPFLQKISQKSAVRVLYPHEVMCQENCEYALSNVPLYYDDSHLQPSAAIWLWRELNAENNLTLSR